MHQADKRSVASVGSYVTFIDNNKNIQNIKGVLMSLETYARLFGARCCDSSRPARSSALALRDFPPVTHAALWPRACSHRAVTITPPKRLVWPSGCNVCVCVFALFACVLSSTPGISVSLRCCHQRGTNGESNVSSNERGRFSDQRKLWKIL